MKRKDFIECMKLHKYKKYISNKVNESYGINITILECKYDT